MRKITFTEEAKIRKLLKVFGEREGMSITSAMNYARSHMILFIGGKIYRYYFVEFSNINEMVTAILFDIMFHKPRDINEVLKEMDYV